jgi:predicted nucleotidyltransferase
MNDAIELGQDIAHRLGMIDGVVAVALGGSWARGHSDLDADIDLAIYYRDEHQPNVDALLELAQGLNSSLDADTIKDFWSQGPLTSDGAWLWIEGRRVDFKAREIGFVQQQVERSSLGVVTGQYQPGYPHGFFSHYYMGAIHECKPLFDPEGVLRTLKGSTERYPYPLKASVVRAFSREADLILFAAQQAAAQEDLYYTVGCLHRCVACLVQVLFAANEIYITHDKGAVEAIMQMKRRPDHFREVVASVLTYPGENASALQDGIAQLRALVSEVQLEYVKPLNLGV